MSGNSALSPESALVADIFDHYCAAQTFKGILGHYRRLCAALNLKPGKFPVFYPKLKSKLKSWKAQGLFAKFDKRASHKCYNQGRACASTKVLVIGCGPCGLRAAIEAQLLGARVVVLEKRDRFSRNNVLHLWPMVIHDLKALGAKKFFGKFCAGAIDHISIRQLQCILLKVALLLGVEVYENVGYEELVEPSDERTGWRARLSPPDHPAADFQFDVLIGADGKRNTFKCFRRKEFRGKLAIAITANFVNRHTEAEARVDEISGVAFIFNQKFFKDLYAATGIELENIVYYKDETHYFVMTAKKQSLLAKGVIIQDFMDTNRLLSPENVNRQKLMQYAREAADFSTDNQLPQLPFALNHYGREDVAMFDFTCMYASLNAGKVMDRHGHKLLLQLVGDSLLEPFWPTGSGCARGFLSCFDAAWQIRSWANPRVTTLECLAERESIYRLLAQTTPKNLSCEYSGYTLDPRTRYPNLLRGSVSPYQVRGLVDTDCPESLQQQLTAAGDDPQAERPAKKARREPLQPDMLLKWCQKQLALTDIQVTDLTLSFKSGLALCGILHKYRPDLIDLSMLSIDDPLANTQLAFSLVESELGVAPVMTAQQMAACACPDRLAMLSYLSQVYDALHGEIPYVKPKIAELLREETSESGGRRSAAGRSQPDGRRSSLSENARKQRKRKSDAAKDKTNVDALDPFAPPEIGPLDPHKLALVAAAFGDDYRYDSGPDSDAEHAEGGAAMARADPLRRQLPVAALEARLAALEAAHAAEPERRQQIRQQRRQLRSLAERKAELEAALLETGASRGDGSAGPDDASLHLYRRTAATFEQRRMKLQDMVFHPGRVVQDLKKGLGPGELGPTKKEEFATKIKDLEAKFKGQYVPPDKKPKDLSRAIGRIEKTDWNLREIERKIEDSKRTHSSREPAQAVPMWNKDMFDDKCQAMKNLSERGAVAPETLQKYADIDQHLRRLELKLREGTTRDVGQRGSNRVSQMAQQFLDRADRAPPPEKKTEAGATEACHFCNERVYLVERMSAEGKFFHLGCFRCEYCGTVLKMMNYAFDEDSGRFFCMPHFGLHSLVKYKYQRKPDQSADTPEKGTLSVPLAPARGSTPERAEFENSVVAVEQEERLSEMDEDEWTDHNFGMSAAELTSEDLLDGDDSEDELSSSGSDAYQPALDEDEVLRLAERWRRRHSHDPLDEPSDLYESDGCDRDGDDSDTATQSETEDDASARLRRQQEVHLAEDVLKSRNRSSKHGDTSDTETSSDSDDSSSSEESSSEDEDATEVATDSEFDEAPASVARQLPTIVIENSAVGEAPWPEPGSPRAGRRPEPIGAELARADTIEPAAGTTAPRSPPAPRQNDAAGPAELVGSADTVERAVRKRPARPRGAEHTETIRNANARPLAHPPNKPGDKLTTEEDEEDSVAKIIREARKSVPAHRHYMIQRTESSEAIAWKSSLELKRKYLTEQSAPYAPCKSQSTTDLDSRVKTFMSRISETQKLLGARPVARPATAVRLTLDSRPAGLSSRVAAGAAVPSASLAITNRPPTSAAVAPPPAAPVGSAVPLASAASPPPPPVPALPPPATSESDTGAEGPGGVVPTSATVVTPDEPDASSASTSDSRQTRTAADGVAPLADASGVAGQDPADLEESLTDVSAVDSRSGETRSAALAALADTMHSSLSSAGAEVSDKQPNNVANVVVSPPVSAVAVKAGQVGSVAAASTLSRPLAALASRGPPCFDNAPADFDALLGGLDVTGVEQKFERVCEYQSPGRAPSHLPTAEPAVPDSRLPQTAEPTESAVPDGQLSQTAEPVVPDSRLPQTAEPAVPDGQLSQTVELAVPDGQLPQTVESAVPDDQLSQTAKLAVPDDQLPQTAESAVPDGQLPQTAESAVPDGQLSQTAESAVPDGQLSQTAEPAVPDGQLPQTAEPTVPDERPNVTTTSDATENSQSLLSKCDSVPGDLPAHVTVSVVGESVADVVNVPSPPTPKVALDVTRLIEENRTLLSQIRRRRSSGEPASPLRRAAEPEPTPTPLPPAAAAAAAADSLDSPVDSGTRDATELDLSDWAHESEVGSVADVPHEFRVDERFVTVRRGAAACGERANLATLSDFEDDVSELPEDPVGGPPTADTGNQFGDFDFADNSASGEEEGRGAGLPPSARNLGRCEYVFQEAVVSGVSVAPVPETVREAHRGPTVPSEPGTDASSTDKPAVDPVSGKTAQYSAADETAVTSEMVTVPSAAPTVKPPPEMRRSALGTLAENKYKHVKSSGYGKLAVLSKSASVGDSFSAAAHPPRKPSVGRAAAGTATQTAAKENGLSEKAFSLGQPMPRGGGEDRARAVMGISASGVGGTPAAVRLPTAAIQTTPKTAARDLPSGAAPAPISARAAAMSSAACTAAPSGPADIRVSPIVEQASARLLLQRSPTDSAIILVQRPLGATSAPVTRAQQGSLVRDLVLSRVKSPERQLRKRLSSPVLGVRAPPPPPPPQSSPPLTPPTAVAPPPKPPRDPTAALSLFTPAAPAARPGALVNALSRSTPSVVERSGAEPPAGAASPDLSSSPERGGPEGRSDPTSGGQDLGRLGHSRRRSIIRAISDIFKSGEKKEKAPSPPPDRVSSVSPAEQRRLVDGSAARPQSVGPPAPVVKTSAVRDRLGIKLRKGKDRRSDATGDEPCGEAEPSDLAGPHSPGSPASEPLHYSQNSGITSPHGAPGRRAKISRAARHAEMRRLQRAQELQRQLDEVEVGQRDLELRGISVEKAIRGEAQSSAGADEASLMHEWFELVHERSLLVRRDQLLQLQMRELELEDRHDRLQLELRNRMATRDSEKTAEDVERERQVVSSLLEISDQRRSLRVAMDSEQERLTGEYESTEGRRAQLASLASSAASGPAESAV